MLLRMCKEEFQVQYFKLGYETPDDFTRCWFQKKKEVLPIWLAYRVILFLYFFASHIYTVFAEGNPSFKYYIFLTNWTYILQVYQTLLAVIITGQRYAAEKKNQADESMGKMPWLYKMYWVIFSITLSCSIIVTVVFWTVVYESAGLKSGPTSRHRRVLNRPDQINVCKRIDQCLLSAIPVLWSIPRDYADKEINSSAFLFIELFPKMARNVLSHGVNSFLMVIDFLLVGHPVRLLHFYWPCLFGLLYVLFTIIYQFSGGTGTRGLTPIYKVLDWKEPGKAILFVFIGSLLILVVHYLAWLISKLKFFYKKNLMTSAA